MHTPRDVVYFLIARVIDEEVISRFKIVRTQTLTTRDYYIIVLDILRTESVRRLS